MSSGGAALTQTLGAYAHVPGLAEGVAALIGAEGPSAIGSSSVVDHVVITTEEVFSLFACTPRALCVFEMNRAGETLSVLVPLLRLRRVAELQGPDGVVVSLEIDADAVRGAFAGRMGEDPAGVRSVEGQVLLNCAVYELRGEDTDIVRFARSLRACVLG